VGAGLKVVRLVRLTGPTILSTKITILALLIAFSFCYASRYYWATRRCISVCSLPGGDKLPRAQDLRENIELENHRQYL
jgi:hypothetical protein